MRVRKEKKSGPKPWMLDMGLVLGKRKRLFFESQKEADNALVEKMEELRINGENALALSHNEKIQIPMLIARAAKINKTLLQCVIIAENTASGYKEKSFSEAVGECVASKEQSGKRERYTKVLKYALGTLLGACKSENVSEVTREQIEAWSRDNAKSLATVRSRLIDAKTFFNFCLKRKWLLENPCNGIERVKLEDKPPGIHTVAEVKALLKCAQEHDPALLGYLCPLYFGGLRPAEAKKLIAAEVHADVLEVTGKKSKTRQRRFVGINKTLAAWLKVPGAVPGMSPRSRRLDKLRWILGGRKMRKTPKGRNVRDVNGFPWPHDALRHSFCSYALPIYGATKTAEMAGHSEAILFAHYRERVKESDAKRFWALRP